MTEINFYYTDKKGMYKFEAEGHANFNPGGPDILCSSISSILQVPIFSKAFIPMLWSVKDGDMILAVVSPTRASDVLMRSVYLAIESLSQQEEFKDHMKVQLVRE